MLGYVFAVLTMIFANFVGFSSGLGGGRELSSSVGASAGLALVWLFAHVHFNMLIRDCQLGVSARST